MSNIPLTKKLFSILLYLCLTFFVPMDFVYPYSSAEAGASNRGSYIAGQGYIIPPEDIIIDSYIAQIDYGYEYPSTKPLMLIAEADSNQNTTLIQIGVTGKKTSYDKLPPMNISFVIDKSGSMSEKDKMTWVKEAFNVFIDKVRPKDFVSLVFFDSEGHVAFPATQMNSYEAKEKFKRVVNDAFPGGSTNMYHGLRKGFLEVKKNYEPNYVNRVLFLSDGIHNGNKSLDDIIALIEKNSEESKSISLSTIALGKDTDIDFLSEMARKGKGSSRFINSREELKNKFSHEIDRLLIASAKDVDISLILSEGVQLKNTWGYNYIIEDNRISYSIPSLHNSDYETILAEVTIGNEIILKDNLLATVVYQYKNFGAYSQEDSRDDGALLEESTVYIHFPSQENKEMSNLRILHSYGYLLYATTLREIGYATNSVEDLQQEYYNKIYSVTNNSSHLSASERMQLLSLKQKIVEEIENIITLTENLWKKLEDIDVNIEGEQFTNEYLILESYIETFDGAIESLDEMDTVIENEYNE